MTDEECYELPCGHYIEKIKDSETNEYEYNLWDDIFCNYFTLGKEEFEALRDVAVRHKKE